MENFCKLYAHFNKLPLISSIRTETNKLKDLNIVKEALNSKQIEFGKISHPQIIFRLFQVNSQKISTQLHVIVP